MLVFGETVMKKFEFSSEYISFFCMEMYLALSAGIPAADALGMLRADERDARTAQALDAMAEHTAAGGALSDAMRSCGAFPQYAADMAQVGERTGRLDDTLSALAGYYERRMRLSRSIRSALLYPAVLLCMMLVVIGVLVTKVLPVFRDVYAQLGSGMSGLALALTNAGMWLGRNRIAVAAVLAVIIAAAVWYLTRPAVRAKIADFGFSKKIGGAVSCSRFAAAMALGMKSGLDADSAAELAEKLAGNTALGGKIAVLRERLSAGENLADSAAAAGIFSARYTRLLSVAYRTGAADEAMEEIARRTAEEAEDAIERFVGRIEPTLVIVMSVLIGLILLAVMLPLLGVMGGIGG